MVNSIVVRSICFAVAALLVLLAACSPDGGPALESAQVTVNALWDLNNVSLPDHLVAPDSTRRGDEFDANE